MGSAIAVIGLIVAASLLVIGVVITNVMFWSKPARERRRG